jgi:glyoxylase-like metal-dependent hydrolase (beta-lactamase superfamily II)
MSLKMYAFHCGGTSTLRSTLDPQDPNCGEHVSLPYFFYLIRHPEGEVLFDCGAHQAFITDPRSRLGAGAEFFDVVMEPGDDVVAQLHTLDIEAEAISHAVQSHLHYDHAGGLEFLSDATVYVQKEELPFATNPPVYQRAVYVNQDFKDVTNWRFLNGEHDIFNDGTLTIFPTPGHTPGHQSLLVKLPKSAYILVGDAAYDLEKMRDRCLPGMLWSPDAMVASWERIEDLKRRHNAELIVTHDQHWKENLRVAPDEWYE